MISQKPVHLTQPALNLELYFHRKHDVFEVAENSLKRRLATLVPTLRRHFHKATRKHGFESVHQTIEYLYDLTDKYRERTFDPAKAQAFEAALDLDAVKFRLGPIGSEEPSAIPGYFKTASCITHRPDLIRAWIDPNMIAAVGSDNLNYYIDGAKIAQHMDEDAQDAYARAFIEQRVLGLQQMIYPKGRKKAELGGMHFHLGIEIRKLSDLQLAVTNMAFLSQLLHPDYITVMKEALIRAKPEGAVSGNITPYDAYAGLAGICVGFPDLLDLFDAEEVLTMGRAMLETERYTAFAKLKAAFRDDVIKQDLLHSAESERGLYLEAVPNRVVAYHTSSGRPQDIVIMFEKTKTGETAISVSGLRDDNHMRTIEQTSTLNDDGTTARDNGIGAALVRTPDIELMNSCIRILAGQGRGFDYAILPDYPRGLKVPEFVQQAAAKLVEGIVPSQWGNPKVKAALEARFADVQPAHLQTYSPTRAHQSWGVRHKLPGSTAP